MKILVITNLFPNNKEPNRSVFNKQQIVELAKLCELQVVAPVAWHRAKGITKEEIYGTQGHKDARTQGLKVYHPRYFMIPKIGRSLYGFFFYFGIIGKVKEIYETFKFDMILATWAYPDGFGSALVSRAFKKPLVIKVHGSDVNLSSKYLLRRKMISYAFKRAEKIIAVSNALKEKIISLGVLGEKIEVIPNGIDTELFKPMDKIKCRKKLNLPLDKKIVLYVGNLEKVKGIDILVEAMKGLPEDINLIVVGNGSLIPRHRDTRLKDRITFTGARPHDEIPVWMNASDVFCLPSRNEGCPNVILEALACGKPIVASRVGGIPEMIKSEEQEILVSPESVTELQGGILKAFGKNWDRAALKQSVMSFDWEENAKRVFAVLDSAKYSSSEVDKNKIKRIIKECITSIIPKQWIIWNGRRSLDRIALTFDDGPNPGFTPKILDILKRYGVKATFFLVGQEVEKHADLAKRIAVEGHSIANHSYSHKIFGALDARGIEGEILKTQDVLIKVFGENGRLFRPPQGVLNLKTLNIAGKHKFSTILWSWELGKIRHGLIRPGDIMLFHDDNDFTLEALPGIIEELKKKPYEFVTVEEMIKG